MIAVFVTFESDTLDEGEVRKIAVDARPMFEGMPGLRSKVMTWADKHDRATNVYVWNDEDAARAFFNDALTELVTGLYGVRPRIEFADVLELIEND